MLVRTLRRILFLFATLATVSGCSKPDTEEQVRAIVRGWIFLAQTQYFHAEKDCSVARFEVVSDQIRRTKGAIPVPSVRSAVPLLKEGQVVVFDIPGATPNQISEQLMSINLFEGLGMLSTFVGSGRRCMDDAFASEAFAVLMSPDTTLIFDPVSYTMVLLYRPAPLAYVIRIKT